VAVAKRLHSLKTPQTLLLKKTDAGCEREGCIWSAMLALQQ